MRCGKLIPPLTLLTLVAGVVACNELGESSAESELRYTGGDGATDTPRVWGSASVSASAAPVPSPAPSPTIGLYDEAGVGVGSGSGAGSSSGSADASAGDADASPPTTNPLPCTEDDLYKCPGLDIRPPPPGSQYEPSFDYCAGPRNNPRFAPYLAAEKFPWEEGDVDGPTAGLRSMTFKIIDTAFIPGKVDNDEGLLIEYQENKKDRKSTVWPITPPGTPNLGDQYFRGDDRSASEDPARTGRLIQWYSGTAVVPDGKISAGLADWGAHCSETMDVIIPKANRVAPPAASKFTKELRGTEKPTSTKKIDPINDTFNNPKQFVGGMWRTTAVGAHPFTKEMPFSGAFIVRTQLEGRWLYSKLEKKDEAIGVGLNVLVCSVFAPFPSHDTSFHIGKKSILLYNYDTKRKHPVPALAETDTVGSCAQIYVNDAGGIWTRPIDPKKKPSEQESWKKRDWCD